MELMLYVVLINVSCSTILVLVPPNTYKQLSTKVTDRIAHKGILCSMPIPSATDVPRLRALFILLEAIFTFVFWTIRIKTKFDLGMHGMRQWTLESLEYEGLYSHNPLRGTVVGDLSFLLRNWRK
jgi:hypothetical protein